MQYALGLGIAGAGFLALRRWWQGGTALVLAMVNGICIAPLFIGAAPPLVEDHARLTVMLANVNAHDGDPVQLLAAVEEGAPDVLLLEEVASRWQDVIGRLEETYPHRIMKIREDNFGIALLSRVPWSHAEVEFTGDAKLPSIHATFALDGRTLHLLGTHPLPPLGSEYSKLRDQQLRAVAKRIAAVEGTWILLGDLNTTRYTATFRDLVDQTGLVDTATGRGLSPTWPAMFPPLWIALDHCLVSEEIRVLSRETGPAIGSDHLPLHLELLIP